MSEKKQKKIPKQKNAPEHELAKQTTQLTKELKNLTKEIYYLKNLEFIQVLKSPYRMMWYSFWKGMFVGLGTVIGASFLVGFLVFIVGKIQFVPVLGDLVKGVIEELDQGNVIQIETKQPAYNLDQEQTTELSDATQTQNDPLALEDRPSCDIPIDYLPEELDSFGQPLL